MRSVMRPITLILLAIGASTPVHAHNILVLSSGDAGLDGQCESLLKGAGHTPTLGDPYHAYTGDGLSGQDVVVLLANANWGSGDMPPAGQQALVDFVEAGGGLVTAEWTVWKASSSNHFAILRGLFPVQRSVNYNSASQITYSQATPDPRLNDGLATAFTFTADNFGGTETNFVARPGATVFYTSSSDAAGVVGWNVSGGWVIQFSTLAAQMEIADADYGRLFANAVTKAALEAPGHAPLLPPTGLIVLLSVLGACMVTGRRALRPVPCRSEAAS